MEFTEIHILASRVISSSRFLHQAIMQRWLNIMTRLIAILAGVFLLFFSTIWPFTPSFCISATEGKRLPSVASAQNSAPGYGPNLAIDENKSTLWVASLKADKTNNNVWFQLDLGSVKQIARLHWLAAAGAPYPASAPTKYHVDVSNDGVQWKMVRNVTDQNVNEPTGNVLLNMDARYVRLVTTQVNDGTGWALGLREIWVTEGRDTSDMSRLWDIKPKMADSRINITWQPTGDPRTKRLNVYRTFSPTEQRGTLIASLDASGHEFSDTVPNWTPYYYWVQASDANGAVLDSSPRVAAFAHPVGIDSERVETFAFWYELYKQISDPNESFRHIGNASFVVGADNGATADLAKLGIGVLPYITLYQTHTWTGSFTKDEDANSVIAKIAPIAFYRHTLKFPGSPPGYVPTVFCRPGNIEFNPQAIQYTTCPNSAQFRDMVLTHVRKEIADGVFGFFVDNGYEDDIAASSVCQSQWHSHYYGDKLTSADAFLGMLMEITCAVKKRNPHGIVMVNGEVPPRSNFYGLRLYDVSDAQLWESYLRSSYSTPKEHADSWEFVYRLSVDLEKAWHAMPPRRMFVLSYPWDRNEAFFCYATAKLSNLPWAAGLGISDPNHKKFGGHFGTYPELINLRLGAPSDVSQYGGEKNGEVYIRRYEAGFVVVNPTRQEQKLIFPLSKRKKYRDVFAVKESSGNRITLLLPPESGRVYLYQ